MPGGGLPTQNWNASHLSFAGGRNSGFVRASGPFAMWYWDQATLPTTYSLASHFPVGDRFFCSVLAQTYPNRRFLFTGTASGTIATNTVTFSTPAPNGTIWDRFDRYGIEWKDYYVDAPSPLIVPGTADTPDRLARFVSISEFLSDARAGTLPAFSLVEPQYEYESEEDPQDIQVGERFVARIARAVMESPNWGRTALFITYDEHGGYYDHVPPPAAVLPDDTPPLLGPGDVPGAYNRYGFRVPLIVISPWAKRGYVSSIVQDHTSILRFVERKWNLGAMTRRDANAQDMTDYFDFRRAAFREPPKIASAPALAPGLERCHGAGLNPPLPGKTNGHGDLAGLRARARGGPARVAFARVDLELNGKVAVVTGASKGIGLAVAKELAAEGAVVTAGARTIEGVQGIEGVTPFAVDLGEPDGPAALVDDAVKRHGQLDILVNNVGFVHPRLDGFLNVGDEDFEASMQLNFYAAVRATRAAVAAMTPRGEGTIVNVVSVNATYEPNGVVVDYGVAKAALLNLAKALSQELGPKGIRITSVSPGQVATDLWLGGEGVAATIGDATGVDAGAVRRQAEAGIPTGRFTTPREVATLVTVLASPRAGNVTGANFIIDGGLLQTL